MELTTLLEWLLRLQPPKHGELLVRPSLTAVVSAYIADEPQTIQFLLGAVDVRNRLVHCVPGTMIPTAEEVQTSADTLSEAVSFLLKSRSKSTEDSDEPSATWQAANDPLGELGKFDAVE